MCCLRTLAGIRLSTVGVEAPARQGARSAHTGCMKATSNAARRDASAARVAQLFPDGPLALPRRPLAGLKACITRGPPHRARRSNEGRRVEKRFRTWIAG